MSDASTSSVPDEVNSLVIQSVKTVTQVKTPTWPLKEGEFFIKTLYSGISAGTELTFFLGTNPKGSEGWDQERRIFRADMEPDNEDIFPKREGYMESGIVTASCNDEYPVGTKVAGIYHHVDGYIATSKDFLIKLPDDFDPLLGIWVAKMAPISLNGILYAADEVQRRTVEKIEGSLDGLRVVVFGAGMIGLLCGVFAKWAGAKEVVIVDSITERLDAAKELGLVPMTALPTLSLELKDRWKAEDSADSGADIAFQCTGSDYLLSEAFMCLREQGTVVDLGFYQQGANQVFLGKEFHHNRLRHVCAQIGAIPRHQADVWNKPRLSEETIRFLQAHGEQIKKVLVTDIISFDEAQAMFERLAERDPKILQVVLQPHPEKA